MEFSNSIVRKLHASDEAKLFMEQSKSIVQYFSLKKEVSKNHIRSFVKLDTTIYISKYALHSFINIFVLSKLVVSIDNIVVALVEAMPNKYISFQCFYNYI